MGMFQDYNFFLNKLLTMFQGIRAALETVVAIKFESQFKQT